MDNRPPPPQSLLDSIPQTGSLHRREPAPVHLWNPPLSGELDMRITRDGTWYYQGGPIERKALAQLFSGILRLDEDGRYYLVTPVERWAIQVDDAPFVATNLNIEGEGQLQRLRFTTSLGDEFEAGTEHPITLKCDPDSGEPAPYILVRANLQALIHRNVFYQLVDLAVAHEQNGHSALGVWSNGQFFPMDGGAEAR
ncbi:DUF1285 domain-containing protein [Halopseudomonas phragmitis]|uniref:Proteophosphoglycan n=2 Tax=Pseudomonadaceae TaxID=135621 RepID=A0A1V0B6Y9_9GAMM|nr:MULTISPECIES: DUF1285 domain-containing protein [Pseudomonadaceae]AQZ95651.1 proteophosphoglycan precursor [Halopseudomonas phragmitis]RHW22617.1 DUF1285 domain-containing protein [Pseudomonas jilinensis]